MAKIYHLLSLNPFQEDWKETNYKCHCILLLEVAACYSNYANSEGTKWEKGKIIKEEINIK